MDVADGAGPAEVSNEADLLAMLPDLAGIGALRVPTEDEAPGSEDGDDERDENDPDPDNDLSDEDDDPYSDEDDALDGDLAEDGLADGFAGDEFDGEGFAPL